MKNNDLKFEPQLTEIDKGQEGEIAEWGNEDQEAAVRGQFCWFVRWSWTVTGMTLTP